MKLTSKLEIEALAQQAGLDVEFSPVGPTEVTLNETLRVKTPFYPFMGKRALKQTVEAIRINEADRILRSAVEEEKRFLHLTPGMSESLRRAGE